jgi:hypothetical protein
MYLIFFIINNYKYIKFLYYCCSIVVLLINFRNYVSCIFFKPEILLKVALNTIIPLFQQQKLCFRQSFTAFQKYLYTPCSNNFFIFYFSIINLKNMACNYSLNVNKLDKLQIKDNNIYDIKLIIRQRRRSYICEEQ